MLLLCLFFLPPVWASDEFSGEFYNDNGIDFIQEQFDAQENQELLKEEIFLFSKEASDNYSNPYSVYDRNGKPRVLKGGVSFDKETSKTVTSKDNSSVIVKKGKHQVFAFSEKPANGNKDFSWGYRRGKFLILHSFERSEFRPELARNNNALESEFKLTENLKFKTSFRNVQAQKGYTQGVALEYGKKDSRFKKINNLKFEVKASTTINPDSDSVKRFGFNTKYYF